jgi:HEAT repeat protein
MLQSPNEVVRIGAAQVLGAVGGAEEVPVLTAALEDESIWVAEHAARGLAQGGGRPVLQALAGSEAPRARLAREVLAEAGA